MKHLTAHKCVGMDMGQMHRAQHLSCLSGGQGDRGDGECSAMKAPCISCSHCPDFRQSTGPKTPAGLCIPLPRAAGGEMREANRACSAGAKSGLTACKGFNMKGFRAPGEAQEHQIC